MKHLKAGRKLGRTSSHRTATLRNMVTALLYHEKIQTTDAKAKELKRLADKMISLGKCGDLHSRRQTLKVIREKGVAKKLFDDIAPRFKDRNGGFTRIMKMGRRRGDNAPVSIIELVVTDKKETKEKSAKDKTKKKQRSSRDT